MDYGLWTENSRSTYNKWDGVARCTTQVIGNPNSKLYILPLTIGTCSVDLVYDVLYIFIQIEDGKKDDDMIRKKHILFHASG